jgi:translocation protein SEC63
MFTIRSHPDKVSFTDDAAKEEADSHFVELTKAYKA